MAMAKGEYNEPSPKAKEGAGLARPRGDGYRSSRSIFLSRGATGSARMPRTNKVDLWTAMWLLSQMNNRHSGRWNGGGGGGWSGGGGGGGFGGFGGGSFGGGGAGGSW
jgi:uncharacterized membrane protein YgcG